MSAGLDIDRRALVLRTGGRRPVSARVPIRTIVACAAMLAATLLITFAALMLGTVVYSPGQVFAALTGAADQATSLFVIEWRLPRALAAAVFGAMLGVAGALFQSVTRNPLGSPDIIGFTAGASAGGVAMVAFVGSGFFLVAAGALGAGLAVAAIVLLLSRGGGVAGFRLVIVGIGLSAMLTALETWFVLASDLELAQIAALWGAGSLNAVSFSYTGPAMLIGLAALAVTGLVLGRRMSLFDLGEDVSAALGVNPGRTRIAAVVAGVVLVAIVTAAAGPISFVALAAPHVGRRIANASGAALGAAACAGALLLATADLIGQHLIPDRSYPVGVVTVAVGGLYLLTLLIRENRKGTL